VETLGFLPRQHIIVFRRRAGPDAVPARD